MPFHRIPRARLHEDITALEREHEIVVTAHIDPDDPAYELVYTRWRDGIETRGGFLGSPVYVDPSIEYAEDATTGPVIAFGDFSRYLKGDDK